MSSLKIEPLDTFTWALTNLPWQSSADPPLWRGANRGSAGAADGKRVAQLTRQAAGRSAEHLMVRRWPWRVEMDVNGWGCHWCNAEKMVICVDNVLIMYWYVDYIWYYLIILLGSCFGDSATTFDAQDGRLWTAWAAPAPGTNKNAWEAAENGWSRKMKKISQESCGQLCPPLLAHENDQGWPGYQSVPGANSDKPGTLAAGHVKALCPRRNDVCCNTIGLLSDPRNHQTPPDTTIRFLPSVNICMYRALS